MIRKMFNVNIVSAGYSYKDFKLNLLDLTFCSNCSMEIWFTHVGVLRAILVVIWQNDQKKV